MNEDAVDILDVPEVASPTQDVVGFCDYVLTSLFRFPWAVAWAEREFPGPVVTWHMRSWDAGAERLDNRVLATLPYVLFRPCLARFGCHYMGGQLYGGYADRTVRHRGLPHALTIHMSNQARTEFWIRIYGRRLAA